MIEYAVDFILIFMLFAVATSGAMFGITATEWTTKKVSKFIRSRAK